MRELIKEVLEITEVPDAGPLNELAFTMALTNPMYGVNDYKKIIIRNILELKQITNSYKSKEVNEDDTNT